MWHSTRGGSAGSGADCGLVVTLGTSCLNGRADLRACPPRLNELTASSMLHPNLTVVVEGHTGQSRGARLQHPAIAKRRADAVVSYLVAREVLLARLRALAKATVAVASNQSAAGGNTSSASR